MLVDFENVHRVDLATLPTHIQVEVFVGASQTRVSVKLVEEAQPLGPRLRWRRVSVQAPEAVDKLICARVGELKAADPTSHVLVLSNDKGFDAVVAAYKGCRRVGSVAEIVERPRPPLGEKAKQMKELLGKSDKSKRPRKRATLTRYVQTHFAKLSGDEVRAVVDELVAQKLITEGDTDQRLAYHF